jgi:hypothetical protein
MSGEVVFHPDGRLLLEENTKWLHENAATLYFKRYFLTGICGIDNMRENR